MQKLFILLAFLSTGCGELMPPSYTIAPLPCPRGETCGPDNSADRIRSVPRRGILDTRTFVTITATDSSASTVEILANGQTFLVLKLGEVARFPLPVAFYRNQRLETTLIARGYDHRGKLIGTDSERFVTRGGDHRYGGREETWEIRLRSLRR